MRCTGCGHESGLKKRLGKWPYTKGETITLVAGAVFLGLFIIFVVGCNGGADGQYNSRKANTVNTHLRWDEQGRPLIDVGNDQGTDTNNRMKVQNPPNAKGPTTMSLTDDGAAVGVAGQWEPTVADAIKSNYRMFYVAAIAGGFVGLVLTFWPMMANSPPLGFGLRGAGIALIVGAGFCVFVPSIIDTIGAIVAVVVLAGILLGGLLFVWAHRVGIRSAFGMAKERGNRMAGVLAAQGKVEEAIAVRSSTDPSYGTAVAAGKVAAVAAVDPIVAAVVANPAPSTKKNPLVP